MAPRAVWKGFLKLGNVSCAVKLYGATTESEKVRFRTLNRKTRAPVKAAYFDAGTDEQVAAEDQVKGYELDKNDFLEVDPAEIKALKITSDHTLDIAGFVDKSAVESVYMDKPYFVAPADALSTETFAVMREAMVRKKKAALASIVLYQKERPVLIEPLGKGMMLTTMRYARTIVAADAVFDGLEASTIDPETAELAGMIMEKKRGKFDPKTFEDRYENALLDLIRAKQAGKAPPKPVPAPKETNVVNLADVLRKSLKAEGVTAPAKPAAAKKGQKAAPAAARRKSA